MRFEQFITDTLKRAGVIANRYCRKKLSVSYKSVQEVVTRADYESERIIAGMIKKSFPTHSIWSEEKIRIKRKSEYCWYIDPIDGTNNYFRSIPIWGISLALYKGAVPVAGGMLFPLENELYYAEANKGAYLNGKKLHVSKIRTLKDAVFVLDDISHLDAVKSSNESLSSFSKNFFQLRIFGAACYTYALLAKGAIDACFHQNLKPGDFAAGKLLVKEAGGLVEEVRREEIGMNKKTTILASNRKLHDKIRKFLLKKEETNFINKKT
ncbi:MAG: inositol monophosphatase [Candidatus Anstonellales archaeon]